MTSLVFLQQVLTYSASEVMPNCTVKLMSDDETREVPRGERGEIWFKGPNRAKGYWRNPEATRHALTEDGWLKTGDIGQVDSDGNYYIVDRKKVIWSKPATVFKANACRN